MGKLGTDLDTSVDIFEDIDLVVSYKVAAVTGPHANAVDAVFLLGDLALFPQLFLCGLFLQLTSCSGCSLGTVVTATA